MAIQSTIPDTGSLCDSFEIVDVEALAEQRLSPGILVLAPPMRILHMNGAAWELIREISEIDPGQGNEHPKSAKGLLPPAVRKVCADFFQDLGGRPHAKDWERLEIKRLIGPAAHPVLVRGFGVPDDRRGGYSRLVLLLEGVGRRKAEFTRNMTQRYQFTEREQTVIECLGMGWTNKEIASALKLALPTVKEHIRHIMDKTKTNTRTGILVQLFRS